MKPITSIIFTLLIITISNCKAQTYTDKVSDAEITDFFSSHLTHEGHRVNEKITQWDSATFYGEVFDTTNAEVRIDHEMKSLFTTENKQFIFQQIRQLKTKKVWGAGSFKDQKLITPKPSNEMAKSLNEAIKKENDYSEFSVPVFTMDKQYCFVKEAHICGPLCSGWSMALFKKMPDGKWTWYKTIWAIQS